MKYVVAGYSQKILVDKKLDIIDAEILRWFIDFYFTGKMTKVIDKKTNFEYVWVKYQAIIDDLPILGITNKQVIARRFKKMVDAGILKSYLHKKNGVYSCFQINEDEYNTLIEYKKDEK